MCAYLGMLQYIFLYHMNCERVVQCGVSPVLVQGFGCNLVGFHITYKINTHLQKQIHSAANIEEKKKTGLLGKRLNLLSRCRISVCFHCHMSRLLLLFIVIVPLSVSMHIRTRAPGSLGSDSRTLEQHLM